MPTSEKPVFLSFAYVGGTFGTIVTYPVSSFHLVGIYEEVFSDVANFPDSEYRPHVRYFSDVRLDHRALGLGGRLLHHRRHHRPLGDRLAGRDQDLALQPPQPTFP